MSFIAGMLVGGGCVAPFLHVLYVYSVRNEAENLMDELHEAWDEIRRLRAQVALHIGSTL